jgi:hypothetical protein
MFGHCFGTKRHCSRLASAKIALNEWTKPQLHRLSTWFGMIPTIRLSIIEAHDGRLPVAKMSTLMSTLFAYTGTSK